MAIFRVMIEAENLPSASKPDTPMGFFAIRVVEAPYLAAAEDLALQCVRDEFRDILAFADKADLRPTLAAVEAEQIAQYPDTAANKGATWFPM